MLTRPVINIVFTVMMMTTIDVDPFDDYDEDDDDLYTIGTICL